MTNGDLKPSARFASGLKIIIPEAIIRSILEMSSMTASTRSFASSATGSFSTVWLARDLK